MAVIGFGLASESACIEVGQGDYFAVVYRRIGGSMVRHTPVQIRAARLEGPRNVDRRVVGAVRDVVKDIDVEPRNVGLAAMYRLCDHPDEQGDRWRRLERQRIVAFDQPGAEQLNVPPLANPLTDAMDIASVALTGNPQMVRPRAVVYPTTNQEATAQPIQWLLEIPGRNSGMSNTNYVALRGTELIVPASELQL
jgi:hypothetical protein